MRLLLVSVLMCLCGQLSSQKLFENDQIETYYRSKYPYKDGKESNEILEDLYFSSKLGKLNMADSLWLKVQEESVNLNSVLDSIAYLTGASFYHLRRERHAEALQLCLKAKSLAQQLSREDLIDHIDLQLGGVYFYMSDFEAAFDEYEKLAIDDETIPSVRAKANSNCGSVLFSLRYKFEGSSRDSLEQEIGKYLNKSIQVSESENDYQSLAVTYSILIPYANLIGNDELAHSYARKAWEASEAIHYDSQKAFIQIKVGDLLAKQGKYQEAIDSLEKALSFYKVQSNRTEIIHCYSFMADCYKDMADFENAEKYVRLGWSESKLLHSDEMAESTSRYRVEFETQEMENDLIERDLEIARQSEYIANRNLLISGLGGLFIGTVLLTLLWRGSQKRKMDRQTFELISEERQKGLDALIEATENERKRIAKDLHDGVVQQLGAIKLRLDGLSVADIDGREISEIKQIAESAAEETRSLSHQMMPKILLDMGLEPSMQQVIDQSLEPLGIKSHFECFGLKPRYPEQIEISIYRIFQELAQNVIKHSGAQHVEVQLMEVKNRLILIVEDDGDGIKVGESKGMGLFNIESRLSPLHGKLEFDEASLSGTAARVIIPLQTDNEL